MGQTLNDFDSKYFNRQMIKITIPVMLQQMVSVCLNLVDTIMVGKISEDALAAVGAANQVYYIYSVVAYGIFSGAAVYAVQFWGIRDLVKLRKILGIDYMVCIAVTIPTILLALFCAPQLIDLFTESQAVIDYGTDYLTIACFSYLFSGLSFVLTYNSRSVAILKVPTTISCIAVALNIVLNYLLIYGKFGFPEMGVRGAATATLVARICELVAMLAYIYVFSKEHPLKAKISEMICVEKELFINVMKTAWPVICNEGLWAVSNAIVFAIYGVISAAALAIVQIAQTVTEVFQTIYTGMGNASTVLIGQALGRGNKDLAYTYAIKVFKLTFYFNLVTMSLLALSILPMAKVYGFNPETTDLLIKSLLVFTVAQLPKMFVYVQVCGILRAGGDTMYCLILEVIFNFFMQIALAYLAVIVLELPLQWAIAVVMLAEVSKAAVCFYRVVSRKWMNVFTGR